MNIIIRHATPNIYDHAAKGTICRVISTLDNDIEEYIQRSDDSENPRWEKI